MPRNVCPRLLLAACGVSLSATGALGQLRIGQWNITSWNASDVAARGAAFQTSIFGVAPNGLSFAPDVLITEEISESNTGGRQAAVDAFRNLLNSACGCGNDWVAAPFVDNQGDTGNALFYRASKVQWLSTTTLGCATAGPSCPSPDVGSGATQSPRDNQRWRVRLVGYSGAGAELYIYGGHFKAGDTSADQLRRNPEALRIRNDANALAAANPNLGGFLLGADFNIQSSAQLAYQYLVGFGGGFPVGDPRLIAAGQFFDPINKPGTWNANCAFRNIHTQEPSTGSGGMDDRHDQILISASLRDGQGLSYMPGSPGGNILTPFIDPSPSCVMSTTATAWNDPNHSYRCWGNDGNHFNQSIDTNGFNTQVGTTIAAALITTVATGGHLPVYLDMQVPAKLGGPSGTIDFGTVALNATAQVTIQISNAANVALFSKDGAGAGIDPLTYTLSASSGFTAPAGTFNRTATAPPAQATSHVISMNTSSAGMKSGTLTITSDDPDVPTRVINLVGMVGSGGPTNPPPGNYDVNGDGVVDAEDLYAWFGLFTDVNGNGTVDAADLAHLQQGLRWNERFDITQGRR